MIVITIIITITVMFIKCVLFLFLLLNVFLFFWGLLLCFSHLLIFKIKYSLFFLLLQYYTRFFFNRLFCIFCVFFCSDSRRLTRFPPLRRTSERRTPTTCGPTSWPCSRAARTPSSAAWWASTRWRPSAGPFCEPTSEPWWLSGRRAAGTPTRRRVRRSVAETHLLLVSGFPSVVPAHLFSSDSAASHFLFARSSSPLVPFFCHHHH